MIAFLRRIVPVFCLACLASATRAEEVSAPIRDDAGLFRADAIARAETRIDDVRRTCDRNLFVRTVPSLASHQRKHFWFLKTPQVNRILDEQAQKIADQSGVQGIYVVICKAPRDVHVVVRPDNDPLFGRHDAETLRRFVARRLHDGDADQVLLALVDHVRATLQAHALRSSTTAVVSEFTLAGILGGCIVLWLGLCIVRFKTRATYPGEEDATWQARRTPALLGAVLGSPSGLWIYDKLYPTSVAATEPLSELETLSAAKGEAVEEKTDGPEHPADERPEDAPMVP